MEAARNVLLTLLLMAAGIGWFSLYGPMELPGERAVAVGGTADVPAEPGDRMEIVLVAGTEGDCTENVTIHREETNMDNLNEFKVALTGAVWAAVGLLGWHGILVLAWIVLMVMDYVSGTLAAKCLGNWSSKVARDGVMHKGGMMLTVMAAGLADLVLWSVLDTVNLGFEWPCLAVVLVLVWYCLTEIGSILENAGKMGAPIPTWFAAALDAGLHIVDQHGEEIADKINKDKREQEGIDNE